MQRGRLGSIPLPRTFPIRDGGIGSMMVVRYSRFPGRAGTCPNHRHFFGEELCCSPHKSPILLMILPI
jgi:hypothetical protein